MSPEALEALFGFDKLIASGCRAKMIDVDSSNDFFVESHPVLSESEDGG